MTTEEVIAVLEDAGSDGREFAMFHHIEKPLHKRPDLCAFLMLDQVCPGTSGMVTWAGHDEIALEVTPEALSRAGVTKEFVTDLVRCGVHYDEDSLRMFV